MIQTIKFGFNEPFTGIWVEGKNEFYFKDKEDLKKTMTDWERYLSRLYGGNIKLVVSSWLEEL